MVGVLEDLNTPFSDNFCSSIWLARQAAFELEDSRPKAVGLAAKRLAQNHKNCQKS